MNQVNEEHELKGIRLYKKVLKSHGWKGLVKELGWKVAIALFVFFLIKGLVWLAIFYGGIEAIKSCM